MAGTSNGAAGGSTINGSSDHAKHSKKGSLDLFANMPEMNPCTFGHPTADHRHARSRPTRESVLKRLYEALMRRSLTKIDLSQRGLKSSDAKLVKMALLQNEQLTSLKLGYNHLEDEGVAILSRGLASHKQLTLLDLGFNHVGDDGCQALANALLQGSSLSTLYLAGNLVSQDGALALSDAIRSPLCHLQRLHLTGNRLGPDGVAAITSAVMEKDGLVELFLGGTSMESMGCNAVARLLEYSKSLKVISLANCDISDDDVHVLAASLKKNRDRLPLEALQLSFNNITCQGLDSLTNALWGSTTLREILLDNNDIGERGGHQLANILPHVKTLQVLDVGFNSIPSAGMRTLMKAVAETNHLVSLSVSGNPIDTNAAKAVAYALAYNRSMTSLFLDHCMIEYEGQRHIVAGFVSNRNTALRKLTGFRIGPIMVTIGLPSALEHWTNEQVLNFVHLMWEQSNGHNQEEAGELDPLYFFQNRVEGPVDATTVVEVAKRAFASLSHNGESVFMRPHSVKYSFDSPLTEDAIMVENSVNGTRPSQPELEHGTHDVEDGMQPEPEYELGNFNGLILQKGPAAKSFVAVPSEPAKPMIPDPIRKKRIVDWLCSNVARFNELSKIPFDARELWQLHQHYFTPVVKEIGGPTVDVGEPRVVNSVPDVSRPAEPVTPSTVSSEEAVIQQSDPALQGSPPPVQSLPMLKRKVSYRFLGDAALTVPYQPPAVTQMIKSNQWNSIPAKRARRNKTRISFLPRIQEKLEMHLYVSHDNALILMRQLYFVECALLRGEIFNEASSHQHLCGVLASEAEMILVDMM